MSATKKLLRSNFRSLVFSRDGNKCVFCAATEKLDAHHITYRSLMPLGGYVLENGITLCPTHHLAAECYHLTNGKEHVKGFHPDDLYQKINSSKELAIQKCYENRSKRG